MKQLFLFTLVLLLSSSSIQSQSITFGATANLGISRITCDIPGLEDFKPKGVLSVNVGIFLEKKINSKMYMGIEALWVQIEGKEISEDKELIVFNVATGETELIGVITSTNLTHSNYVGLPIYYRYEIGNLGIKAAWQTMLFLSASSSSKTEGTINGTTFSDESRKESVKLNKIDLGPKLGIDYQLNNKLRLRADYYYGLTNAFYSTSNSSSSWEKRISQFSVGLSCVFLGEYKE